MVALGSTINMLSKSFTRNHTVRNDNFLKTTFFRVAFLIDYLDQIMQALASVEAKRKLDLIVPESIKPAILRHTRQSRILAAGDVIYFI